MGLLVHGGWLKNKWGQTSPQANRRLTHLGKIGGRPRKKKRKSPFPSVGLFNPKNDLEKGLQKEWEGQGDKNSLIEAGIRLTFSRGTPGGCWKKSTGHALLPDKTEEGARGKIRKRIERRRDAGRGLWKRKVGSLERRLTSKRTT